MSKIEYNDFFYDSKEEFDEKIDNIHDWEKEWVGMPEFVQPKLTPYHVIEIKFPKKEDLEKFQELLDCTITTKTKSIWFPIEGLNLHIDGAFYDNE